MILSLEKRENIKTTLGNSELEEKESSIVARIEDPSILNSLAARGYINFRDAYEYMSIINEYEAVIYISILFEYNVLPIEIGGLKVKSPDLELCEKLGERFKLVMPCTNGTVIWMGLKGGN